MLLNVLACDVITLIISELFENVQPFSFHRGSKPFKLWDAPDNRDVSNLALVCSSFRDATLPYRFRQIRFRSFAKMEQFTAFLNERGDLSSFIRAVWFDRPGYLDIHCRKAVENLLVRLTELESLQASFRGYLERPFLVALARCSSLNNLWIDCDMVEALPVTELRSLRLRSIHVGLLKLHHPADSDFLPLHDILSGLSRHTLENLEISCFSGGAVEVGRMCASQFIPEDAHLERLSTLSFAGKLQIDPGFLPRVSHSFPSLRILNVGTQGVNAVDLQASGSWPTLSRIYLSYFMSVENQTAVSSERVFVNAPSLQDLCIANIPHPGPFKRFCRDISASGFSNLCKLSLFMHLIGPQSEILVEDIEKLSSVLINVEMLALWTAVYSNRTDQKTWTCDMVNCATSFRRTYSFSGSPVETLRLTTSI